ncbi:MAG: YggU family protein [Candidatus Diapherotrites archaeon]|nr:YggU family protein [Candidatus Diapherotrites archaeon]
MFTQTPFGVVIDVHVITNADAFSIVGVDEWTKELKIKVVSEPKKGKANRELLAHLRKVLDTEVKIISGLGSNKKRILVEGLTIDEIKNKLRI